MSASDARRLDSIHAAFGPDLLAALDDALVTEILINPCGRVFVDRIPEGLAELPRRMSARDAERLVRLLADHNGEVATARAPRVSGVVPMAAARFQAMLPPLTSGPALSIRKQATRVFALEDFVASGRMSEEHLIRLRSLLERRRNIVIAGAAASGKTTFANAILNEGGFRRERVIIIEDTPELVCASGSGLKLQSRKGDPEVTVRDLVRDVLRLRPDRIVVGELRDGSAHDLLKAWNTGHSGGLTTVHANSAADALARLVSLAEEAGFGSAVSGVEQAVDAVVYMERFRSGGGAVREILSRR